MIPNTDRMIRISKMMKRTRTICATGAGRGNILISHHMSPKTTRYTIRLIIKFIFPSLLLKKIAYPIVDRPKETTIPSLIIEH